MSALEIAEHFRLAALHAEKVSGARHVDIEKGTPHQEVGGFGGDILGKFGQPLRGNDTGKPALAATAHKVGHGAKRKLARFVGHFTGCGRRKSCASSTTTSIGYQ